MRFVWLLMYSLYLVVDEFSGLPSFIDHLYFLYAHSLVSFSTALIHAHYSFCEVLQELPSLKRGLEMFSHLLFQIHITGEMQINCHKLVSQDSFWAGAPETGARFTCLLVRSKAGAPEGRVPEYDPLFQGKKVT